MTIAFVQKATGNGSTITLNGVKSGNAVFFQESAFDNSSAAALATPTDSNGTFHVSDASAGSLVGGFGTAVSGIWDQQNAAAGTHTVTPSQRGGYNGTVSEFSGLLSSNMFDANAHASSGVGGQTSQVSGTTGATAQKDELALSAFGIAATPGSTSMGITDPISGWSTLNVMQNDQSDLGTMHAYKILSATGTQAVTCTWTDNSGTEASSGCIATFIAASPGISFPDMRLFPIEKLAARARGSL